MVSLCYSVVCALSGVTVPVSQEKLRQQYGMKVFESVTTKIIALELPWKFCFGDCCFKTIFKLLAISPQSQLFGADF